MARGGKRDGAGRKRDVLKDLRTGAVTAQKILKQINDEKEIPELYKLLTPVQKIGAIFRLRESAYGRPGTSQEDSAKRPPNINVIIRTVGQ